MRTFAEIAARRKRIITFLSANPNEYYHGEELGEKIGVSRFVIQNDMKAIKLEHPELSITKKGYMWMMEEKKNPMKNHEGYYDPTAGKAIRNLENSSSEKPWKPGEVWHAGGSRGTNDLLLVVSVGGDTSCCLFLYNYDDPYANRGKPENLKHIAWTTHDFLIDTSKLGQRPNRYFEDRAFTLPLSLFTEIKGMIARNLGIESLVVEKEVKVEVPVEKVVEKEVKVEVPGSGKYTEEELNKLLLEQRIDIYERILKRHGYDFLDE